MGSADTLTFLHPELLALSALALIPVLYHLVERFLRRKVDLPTFRFLMTRETTDRARRRLVERILLAMRTAAILVAVVAWARPVPRAEQELRVRTEGRLVILVDRSLSMRAVVAGRARRDEAADAAQRLIENSPRGTAYTVIAFDDTAEALCENEKNPTKALELVRSIAPGSRGTSLGAALSVARSSLLGSGGPDDPVHAARIAILSDLQKSSLRDLAPGLFRDLAVQFVFEPRLSTPAPPNSGVGEIASDIFDGMLSLAVKPSGSRDVSIAGRKWRVKTAAGEKEWPADARTLDVGGVPEGDAVSVKVALTGSDCLEADDRSEIRIATPRRIPVLLRASPAARPYLAAVVRAINGTEVTDPRGAILVGDGEEGAHALGLGDAQPGLAAALLFRPSTPGSTGDEAGAWRLGSGSLAVDGIGAMRVRRRTNLGSGGTVLLTFSDNRPAAIEKKSPDDPVHPNAPPTIVFAFGADLSSGDAVLSTAFPILVRKAFQHLGIGAEGAILDRTPVAGPEESDLDGARPEEFASMIGDTGGPSHLIASTSGDEDPQRWASIALAGALVLLTGETLLARKKTG